jgi:nitric-oxide synthase, bacterial
MTMETKPAQATGGAGLLAAAAEYLTGPDAPPHADLRARLRRVRDQIERTGTYAQTFGELAHGAALAWRNHSRCVGRLHWKSLRVVDRRDASTAEDVFEACLEHLRSATNGGDIRSTITVFAPRRPDGAEIRIWNSQLVRYAGYRQRDGSCVGDPLNADLTEAIQGLGWRGPGGRFDVLPLVIEMPGSGPRIFELPADAVLEVPIEHPEFPWFAALGLRWHALPAISDMRLDLAGLSYPACPFNGWYVSSEIGARNLSDSCRYDMLLAVAQGMGLDTRTTKSLWKDRALIELNQAVLYSFSQAGVRMVDHHVAARQFCLHEEREQAAGRITCADWSWIVPPLSGSTVPTFERAYPDTDIMPNFYRQPRPWSAVN